LAPLARTTCGDSLEVPGLLSIDGAAWGSDPAATLPRERYRKELPALDPGQLPAALEGVASTIDEVVEIGGSAVPLVAG
jgi:hypothetical protein